MPNTKHMSEEGFGPTGYDGGRIISAVLDNNFEMVDQCLASDPTQINARDMKTEITPLIAAASRGLSNMVTHLIGKPGIELDLVDRSGRSALDHARIYPDIVAAIMEAKLGGVDWQEPNVQPV